VVARIAMPRRSECRSGLTEGETGELDEHHFDRDIAAAGGVKQLRVGAQVGGQEVRVAAAAQGRELEVALTEGADHAVFRGGTGINRERHTGTGSKVVAITIALTKITRPSRSIVDAAVERGVDADVAADLHASVSARDVEESGTIQGAN